MLALKGICVKCKKQLTVFEVGLFCNDCEQVTHGDCMVPPMGKKDLEAYVIKKKQWFCPDCKAKRGAEFEEDARTSKEAREIKRKLEQIEEIRQLLVQIDKALEDTTKKVEELTERAKDKQMKNLDLRIRLIQQKGKAPLVRVVPVQDKKPSVSATRASIARAMSILPQESQKKTVKKKRFFSKKAPKEKPKDSKDEEMGNFLNNVKAYAFSHSLGVGERLLIWLHGSLTNLSQGWLLHVVLLIIIILYTILGAAIFYWIEGNEERRLLQDAKDLKAVTIANMLKHSAPPSKQPAKTRMLNKRYQDVTNSVFQDKADINKELEEYYETMEKNYYDTRGKLFSRGDSTENWSFIGAVFFCGTTYTTIGYGDIVPVTKVGKIFTILYALFGIPLFLTLLAALGQTFTRVIKFCWFCMKGCFDWCIRKKKGIKRRRGRSTIKKEEEKDFQVPVTVGVILEILYLIIGAFIFLDRDPDNWVFRESFYFVFISMTTIGFGDLVPKNVDFMLVAFIYIFFGLALTSMVITIIREKLIATFEKATEKLGSKIEQYIEDQYYSDIDENEPAQ